VIFPNILFALSKKVRVQNFGILLLKNPPLLLTVILIKLDYVKQLQNRLLCAKEGSLKILNRLKSRVFWYDFLIKI